jgi:hypothetical protein
MTSPDAHARRSDPISSHLTVASLGKDTALKHLVLMAAFTLELNDITLWNDTELTEWIERHTHKRQQRSVIARSRGLMTTDGWFAPQGMFPYNGRLLMHYATTPEAQHAPYDTDARYVP